MIVDPNYGSDEISMTNKISEKRLSLTHNDCRFKKILDIYTNLHDNDSKSKKLKPSDGALVFGVHDITGHLLKVASVPLALLSQSFRSPPLTIKTVANLGSRPSKQ